jgi:hypothetical protein
MLKKGLNRCHHIVWQLLTIAITPAGSFTKIVRRTFFNVPPSLSPQKKTLTVSSGLFVL